MNEEEAKKVFDGLPGNLKAEFIKIRQERANERKIIGKWGIRIEMLILLLFAVGIVFFRNMYVGLIPLFIFIVVEISIFYRIDLHSERAWASVNDGKPLFGFREMRRSYRYWEMVTNE